MSLDLLRAAIVKGDAAAVQTLLASSPGLANARTAEGVSMVSLACYCRQPAIARTLVHSGAELDLFDACALGDQARVRELLPTHDVNAYSPDGFYALGLAAFFHHPALVALLLEHGASVHQHARNALRVTPLHAAVSSGSLEIVQLLLAAGANVSATQQQGYTALHGAAGAGRQDLADLLLHHGADRNAASDDGKTPADIARERGHRDLAVYLS